MANVFRFRGGNAIRAHESVEIQISGGWEYVDHPVDIVLQELDLAFVESSRERGLRTVRTGDTPQLLADMAAHRWNDIGKVEAQAVRHVGRAYFFEPDGIRRVLPDTEPRQPIPFKLIVPTGPGRTNREFTFWITGDAESLYEVAIVIKERGGADLAPSANQFMLFTVQGSVVMPRFLEIVQPYFRSNWSPSTENEREIAEEEEEEILAQNIIEAISRQLAGSNIQSFLDGMAPYTGAEPRRDAWVRQAVEHMTGLPYKQGHQAYGGRANGGDDTNNWRDYVLVNGDYPCCNVCDQLALMIQYIRGLPHSGSAQDYFRGGLTLHARKYREWAGDSALAASGARYYDTTAEARANITEWAKPGASIFFKKIEWDNASWSWVTRTDASGVVIGHENTIMRTRNGAHGLEVQLFDYGGNIQGGPVRGNVGPLQPVAQESGWIRAENVLTLLDQAARPARPANPERGREAVPAKPASPPKFHSVGYRATSPSALRRLGRPLGEATLSIWKAGRRIGGQTHSQLHDSSFRVTMHPVTHYMRALSGLPHPQVTQARITIRSRILFADAGSPMDLLELSTDAEGFVHIRSIVPR